MNVTGSWILLNDKLSSTRSSNIHSAGDGLVVGTVRQKPLPKPMITQLCVPIYGIFTGYKESILAHSSTHYEI